MGCLKMEKDSLDTDVSVPLGSPTIFSLGFDFETISEKEDKLIL